MAANHLVIAYQATVVALALVALAFVVLWTVKTRRPAFRLFCLFHGLFTGVLILSLFRRYLFTNLPESSVWIGYLSYAAGTVLEHSALAAAALYFNSYLEVSGEKLRGVSSKSIQRCSSCRPDSIQRSMFAHPGHGYAALETWIRVRGGLEEDYR